MSKRKKQIKNYFSFVYFFIFAFSLFIFGYFVVSNYVKTTSKRWVDELDKKVTVIANEIEQTQGMLSEEYRLNHHLFVIDQETGKFIYDRNITEGGNDLWESYKTKLIYKMQKQKRGWIYYPEENGLGQGTNVIRFLLVDDLGWIVAVEDYMESDLFKISQVLNINIVLNFIVILFVVFFLVRIISDKFYELIKKQFSQSSEGDDLNFTNEKIWKRAREKGAQEIKLNSNYNQSLSKNNDQNQKDIKADFQTKVKKTLDNLEDISTDKNNTVDVAAQEKKDDIDDSMKPLKPKTFKMEQTLLENKSEKHAVQMQTFKNESISDDTNKKSNEILSDKSENNNQERNSYIETKLEDFQVNPQAEAKNNIEIQNINNTSINNGKNEISLNEDAMDLKDIKSSLLKKMIKEMRDKT
ncbi:MAG: hypothetical protein H6755_05740 [Candidatus Omnitrophica bacterium]|nr:hypothetical protein [Candidatus Omnitrophota bacterium]